MQIFEKYQLSIKFEYQYYYVEKYDTCSEESSFDFFLIVTLTFGIYYSSYLVFSYHQLEKAIEDFLIRIPMGIEFEQKRI